MFKKEWKETKKRIVYIAQNNIFLLITSIYIIFTNFIFYLLEGYQFIAKNNNLQQIQFNYSFLHKSCAFIPICIWVLAMNMKKCIFKSHNKLIKKTFYWINLITICMFFLYCVSAYVSVFFLTSYSNSTDSTLVIGELIYCFELFILLPIILVLFLISIMKKKN